MSIINEALKKTESFLQQNEAKKNTIIVNKNAPKPYLLYLLILLIGIFLSNAIFNLLTHKTNTAKTPQKPVLSTTSLTPTLTPPPPESILPKEEKKTPPATFVLNGIFFSDSDSYALINNQIVRENESVDSAKVLHINEDSVELDHQGEIITLNSGR
ncbi:MAG: hypothetical protein WC543_06485 [Candidatus Omnitrophota bacterium]